LLINIGTTTEEVARALRHHTGLHVVTNNLNVATIMAGQPGCEVIVAGGVVRGRDRGIVGEATVEFIRQFRVDIGIIGVSSIEPDGTLRDFDSREVKVAQAIIEQSREIWLVADQDKFVRQALVRLAHLSQMDRLFCDAEPPPALRALIEEARVELVISA
jgi:DeoR family glycerol-3-phosphate regulon repressor